MKVSPRVRARTAARLLAVATCALAALCAGAAPREAAPAPRVLFVGNSLTYTHRLPAVFAEISDAIADATPGAAPYRVDMFARGGASLGELERDPRLAALIDSGRYAAVVLQERGGDALCTTTPTERRAAACRALIETHLRLARRARAANARVLYLGTYQRMPAVSRALVAAEATLARRMGAGHVEISETLRAAEAAHPDLPWRHADGAHPGVATTALIAARAYFALHGVLPAPFRLCVDAARFPPERTPEVPLYDADADAATAADACTLDETRMARVLDAARTSPATESGA